jgi:D-glycero-alpha-D-manno-heptose-7-phosphate kinase
MIITRTPFRVSFVGGGSDLKDFYSENGYGAVVTTAINKYMYIVIHPYFHDKIRVKYSRTEDVEEVDEISHPIVRECLRKVQIGRGIEIASFADVPAGTGLGSSSAFTVGLLNALYAYKGRVISKEKLAKEACEIEIDILGEPIGKQDQYASAYGNINFLRFNKDETVDVAPILLTELSKKELERKLCLYYVGGERRASDILSEQKKNLRMDDKFQNLRRLVALAGELREILQQEEIDHLGSILHKGWQCKKGLSEGISNEEIDQLYAQFLEYGAVGGKLLGAGSGGFLLIFAEDHASLQQHFRLKTLPFNMDREGTKIIFYD